MTQQIIIMRGLPGSGKSTYAREMRRQAALGDDPVRCVIVNRDTLREMLNGEYRPELEPFIIAVRNNLITVSLINGLNVIVDDTNFGWHEQYIREIAASFPAPGVAVTIVDLTDVPLETCIERDAAREHPVTEKVIRDMWQRWLAPPDPETMPGQLKGYITLDSPEAQPVEVNITLSTPDEAQG